MGKPKERVHLIDLEVDGVDNIKFNLKGTRWEGVHWSDLAQERDKGWALVNMVMDIGFSTRWGVS